VGIGQALLSHGSWVTAACALVIGALLLALGLTQTSLMVGPYHWVVQVIHLALGLTAIGVGHMAAARYKKSAAS
jgi:hypothetical protein